MPARILLKNGDAQKMGLDLEAMTPGVRTALQQLEGDGIAEEELVAITLDVDGADGLPLLYYAIRQMTQNGCLAYVAASDSGALASTSATKSFDRASRPAPAARYVLSRFAFIRRDGARTVIESARSAIQIT